MQNLQTLKEKINFKLFIWLNGIMMAMNKSPLLAHAADGEVNLPKTEIGSDGNVTFATGDKADLGSAVNNFLAGGTRVFGWVIAIAGLLMIIVGAVQAYQASKRIQEGNQEGWGSTKNIILGLLVGGVLFAIIGLMVGFGVGFGNSMFSN